MKISRVLFGITAGVASGIAVSWLNRDDQSVKNNTIDAKEHTVIREWRWIHYEYFATLFINAKIDLTVFTDS